MSRPGRLKLFRRKLRLSRTNVVVPKTRAQHSGPKIRIGNSGAWGAAPACHAGVRAATTAERTAANVAGFGARIPPPERRFAEVKLRSGLRFGLSGMGDGEDFSGAAEISEISGS